MSVYRPLVLALGRALRIGTADTLDLSNPTRAATGPTDTFVAGDVCSSVRYTNTGGCVITVPNNTSVAIPIDAFVTVQVASSVTGSVTIAGAIGVTLTSIQGTGTQTAAGPGAVIVFRKVATNSWAVSGDLQGASPVLYFSNTETSVGNTITKTALWTIPIPAGSLGTDGAIDITQLGALLINVAASPVTLELKLGSTVLWSDTTGSLVTSATERKFDLVGTLYARGATNKQRFNGSIAISNSTGTTTGSGDVAASPSGTAGAFFEIGDAAEAAEDSTTLLNLVLSVTWATASTTRVAYARRLDAVLRNTTSGIRGPKGDTGATGTSGAGTGQVPPATAQTASFSTTSAQVDHETLCSHATVPIVVTITAASFAADGAMMSFRQGAAAAVSFVAGSGITIRSSATSVATPILRKLWSACSARLDTVAGGIVYMDGDFQ